MLRVVVLLATFVSAYAWGQVAPPPVLDSELDAATARVTENLPDDDPQRASLLGSYAETRAELSSAEQFNKLYKGFALSRANALQEAASIEEALEKPIDSPQQSDKKLSSVTLLELEQLIQVDRTQLEARKSQLTDTRADIDEIQRRPAEIRSRVTELVGLAADMKAELGVMNKSVAVDSTEEAALWLAQAQLSSVNSEKAALEEELLSQPMRLRLLKAQLDQASYDIVELEERLRGMTLRAGELRQREAAKAQAAADLVLADTKGKHKLVRELADANFELSKTFSERGESIEKAVEREIAIRSAAEQLEIDMVSIERKLELLGMSSAVGLILRERQAQLPERRELAREIAENADAIRASSMRQIDLEDERRRLRDQAGHIRKLVRGLKPEVVGKVSADLGVLLSARLDLIRTAMELESTYANLLGDLDFSLQRDAAAADKYYQFISEKMLWIPSRDRFAIYQFDGGVIQQIREITDPGRWSTVLQTVPREIVAQPMIIGSFLLVLLLVYYGPRLKRQLADTGKRVGYVRYDSFFSTLQAVGLTLLLSIKWPLLLLSIAWLFKSQNSEPELATAIYTSFMRTALYFWALEFLRIALHSKGLVGVHFRWPASRATLLRRQIIILERSFLPAAFMVIFLLQLYARRDGGPLGTLGIVVVLFSLAYFFRNMPQFVETRMHMVFRHESAAERPPWGTLIRKVLFWIPIASIFAVFFGYAYTAIEMALLLIRTFMLLSFILILHELGLRWLRLAKRRMDYKVRQELANSRNDDGETSVEDEMLENDPELLNDEGTKLLNLLMLFASLLGVAVIWSEVFPALGILDSVELWHQSAVIDGREVSDPVTLGHLFRALLIATVGWVALRRIPSLLEIFLRQNVKVSAASAYAITRVFQYGSTALLLIFVMGSLGASWSSMQWAVAALSLGIGFGLQEIVANFISGLIILFEQPIRVGDVVSVGEVSGTVTRIQMRATTIRDFDRRELLVPNKEFITSQLLNWSLSDPVTRRVVDVGVAYGTDLDEAMKIVGEVARLHPVVLADPEWMITFDQFGDNSLLISLRYFIENLELRRKVDSDLRLEINRRFNDAGIVVAFPQRDVHIDTAQPLEVRMVESGQNK